jgi:hypothetical protein
MGGGGWLVVGGGGFVADGGPSVGGGVGPPVVGGGGFSAAGGGSSVVGVGSSVTGGDSSVAGDDVFGSLVVGGGASVVVGREGSAVLDGDVSPVLGEGSSEAGVAVLGVGRAAGEGATELLLLLLLVLAIRALPEPAPAKPSRTFRTVFCTVSLLPSSSVAACSSICSATPGRTRSTTCRGIGLSESGANQVSNETTATAAAITPAPANKDFCLSPLRRPRRRFGRAKAGAFILRPLLLSRINFSIRSTLSYRKTRQIKIPPAISPAPKPSVSKTIFTSRRRRRPG